MNCLSTHRSDPFLVEQLYEWRKRHATLHFTLIDGRKQELKGIEYQINEMGNVKVYNWTSYTFLSWVKEIRCEDAAIELSSVPRLQQLCIRSLLKNQKTPNELPLHLILPVEGEKLVAEKKALVRPENPHFDTTYFAKLADLLYRGLHKAFIAEEDRATFCVLGERYIREEKKEEALCCYRAAIRMSDGFIPNQILCNIFTLQLMQKGYLIADSLLAKKKMQKHQIDNYVSLSIREKYKTACSHFKNIAEDQEEEAYSDFFEKWADRIEKKENEITLYNVPADYLAPLLSRLIQRALDREDQLDAMLLFKRLSSIRFIYNTFESTCAILRLLEKPWAPLELKAEIQKYVDAFKLHPKEHCIAGPRSRKIERGEIQEMEKIIKKLQKEAKN